MSKGKHAKPGSYVKPKFKKSLLFVLFSLIILCIIFDILVPATDTESIASTNELQNNTTAETTTTLENLPEEIEPTEDENMKTLIEYEINKYGFDDTNFAFFYYNVNDKKYYFYNENSYFTAASTIKVPIAMYYYDEINSNTLSLDSTILYASGCYEAGSRNYSFSIFCR